MYRNVRETLLEGLRSREEACGYKTFVHVPDNDTENGKYPVQMRRGDVLIHIGLEPGRAIFSAACALEPSGTTDTLWFGEISLDTTCLGLEQPSCLGLE